MTGSRRRALIGIGALLLLLLAVAVASTGSTPVGSGGARRPSERVLDVVFSLFLLLMGVGTILWGYILVLRKDVAAEAHAARSHRGPWVSIVGLAVGIGLFALAVRWFSLDENARQGSDGGLGPLDPGNSGAARSNPNDYRPEFATGPVLVVVGLLAVSAAAWYRADRARKRRPSTILESLLPELGDVLEETLDDLRAEADPRRAVIAAYARMERALAAYGLPRSPAEAPDEYLERIFADIEVSRSATSRLTSLFAAARFSTHDVDARMKQEAIGALEGLRAELRAAELRAEHERAGAAAKPRERVVT